MRHAVAFLLVAALLNIRTAGAGNLVVVVNPASGIENLTRSQAIDIFLGRHRVALTGSAMERDVRIMIGMPRITAAV